MQRNLVKKALLGLALLALSSTAVAAESNGIGYNYAQLDLVITEPSDRSLGHSDGGALTGSYAVTDDFFVFGGYGRSSLQVSNEPRARAVAKDWSLGAGFNQPIGSRADWVTRVAYVYSDINTSTSSCGITGCVNGSSSDYINGGFVSTGVLGQVTSALSANAYVGYQDCQECDGNFFADFGAVYAFTPVWGVHGGLQISEGGETYSLGVRASF